MFSLRVTHNLYASAPNKKRLQNETFFLFHVQNDLLQKRIKECL